uniref:SH3 domain-containing protein n=1 Tax=Ganoderma boninense TaxID=34458 RepID=A0A5K1K406_9APHY|nr:SH3 domain-containing protein [Ganoderma boninense]
MIDFITANLVSGFVEFTLFGIFMLLSSASLVLLLRRHRIVYGAPHDSKERTAPWRKLALTIWGLRRSPLILANVLLILTVTVHFGFSAERLVRAMVNQGGADQSVAFLIDLRERTQVARLILLVISMFLGDVVITYRVWLVWSYNHWITLFPMLTVAGVIGSGMIRQFTVSHSDTGVFTAAVGPWITATCVTTVCTNFYGTVVIAYRVWSSNRLLRSTGVLEGGRNLLDSIAIFVESAALWTFWVILYLIWYLTGSRLETIGSGTGPVVIGITFTLITVRVGLGWGQETRTATASLRWAGNFNATSATGLSHDRQQGRRRADLARPQAISLTVTRGTSEGPGNGIEGGLGSVADIDVGKAKLDGVPQRSGDTFGGSV